MSYVDKYDSDTLLLYSNELKMLYEPSSFEFYDILCASTYALDKQVPVKVEYESSGDADGHPVYDYASCPICGYDFEECVNDWQSNFCPECGQRLDWTMDN